MTIDRLQEVNRAAPFRRYRLELADGNQIEVPHPEFVLINPKNPRTVVVSMPDGGFKIIDLLLVAAIHVGNGRAASKRKG